MADQGKWFKLWCSAADDPDLSNLSDEDFGRWCRMGIYLKEHGTNGSITIRRPGRALLQLFHVTTLEMALSILADFPNCDTAITENDVSITWLNWKQYQGDMRDEKNSGFVKDRGKWKSRAEARFADILREIDIEFKEQQRFPDGKTFYTVDFFIPSKQLAFEIQGPEHATKKYRGIDDRKRASLMANYGVFVIAIDNTSILQNVDFVKKYVIESIESKIALSSPTREERRREEKRQEEKINTPVVPKGDGGKFEDFWAAYPKKKSKGQAERAWKSLKPDSQLVATMLAALEVQSASWDWLKDAGQFIPNPATWLNGKRWLDDAGTVVPKPVVPSDPVCKCGLKELYHPEVSRQATKCEQFQPAGGVLVSA